MASSLGGWRRIGGAIAGVVVVGGGGFSVCARTERKRRREHTISTRLRRAANADRDLTRGVTWIVDETRTDEYGDEAVRVDLSNESDTITSALESAFEDRGESFFSSTLIGKPPEIITDAVDAALEKLAEEANDAPETRPPMIVISLGRASRDVGAVIGWSRSLARRRLARVIVWNADVNHILDAAANDVAEEDDDVIIMRTPRLTTISTPLAESTKETFARMRQRVTFMDRHDDGIVSPEALAMSLLSTFHGDTQSLGVHAPNGCMNLHAAIRAGAFSYVMKEWIALAQATALERAETCDARVLVEIDSLRRDMFDALVRCGLLRLVPRLSASTPNDEDEKKEFVHIPLRAFENIFSFDDLVVLSDAQDALRSRRNEFWTHFWLCAAIHDDDDDDDDKHTQAHVMDTHLREYHFAVDMSFLELDQLKLKDERRRFDGAKQTLRDQAMDEDKRVLVDIELHRMERDLAQREREANDRLLRIARHYGRSPAQPQ